MLSAKDERAGCTPSASDSGTTRSNKHRTYHRHEQMWLTMMHKYKFNRLPERTLNIDDYDRERIAQILTKEFTQPITARSRNNILLLEYG